MKGISALGLTGLAVLGAALFLRAVAPPGSQPVQAQPQDLQHDVSVILKLIQVYVTDKDGRPVRDLAREEFALFDNGRPVAITAFEKHDLTAAPVGEAVPAPEPKPVAVPDEAPSLSRKFIILFDFAFNTASGVKASIDAARRFLDTEVRSDDEVAFISYSMIKGLRIREFLTKDHAKVQAALAAVSSKDVAGRADEIEMAYWLQVENPALGGTAPRMGLSQIEMLRLDSMQQAGNYFRGMIRLAQALRLIEGRKNILFFSNGIPSSLVNASRAAGGRIVSGRGVNTSGSSPAAGTTAFQVGNYELRPLQETLFKEFGASDCSVFAFDTRQSSMIPALFELDQMNFAAGGGTLGADGKIFRDDKTTGMDSLKSLSKQTGGKYYSNIILHEKNLEEVSAVTGTYYVLGYPVSAAADGTFHTIKIEVGRPGCQVRAQPGYFNPKPYRKYTDLEKNIHLFDLALNVRSDFQAPKMLPMTALAYDGGPGARVRSLARIPAVIWDQFGGQTMELVALFFDSQDSLLSLQRLALSRADHGGREMLFTAGTAARPGATKCRIVLRDMDTGQSVVASTIVYSVPANRQSLAVFSPLLIAAGGGLFHLEGVVKGAAESPHWRELYPYDAAAFSPVFGGEAVSSGKIGAIVPYSAPGLGVTDLTFRANIVGSASGQNLAVPLELRESTSPGTVEAQQFELSLEAIPSGAYTLYIHIGNKISGQVVSARAPLTIAR